MNLIFSRTDQSLLGKWWWTVDRALIISIFVLMVFGLTLVAAASPPVASRIGLEEFHFLKKHLVFLCPSIIMMIGISLLNLKYIWRLGTLILLGSVIAMVVVLVIGTEIKGAQRWIPVFGFSLQPSEFVKVGFAVVTAWLMARQKEIPEFPGNKLVAAMFLVVIALLLLQPDFGMSFVITCIFGVQIFLAGLPFSWMLLFGLLAIFLVIGSYFTFDHVQSRIDRFIDPASGDSYQVQKSMEAFQSGGLFGAGPGQGTVKLNIPDAHSDFIFAVAGEELGLFFVAIIIFVYGFIILRGLNRAIDSNDMFVILSVGGLLTLIAMQVFIHMGANLQLLPAKGMTLPFVSYGGSSMLATSIAFGMILALTRFRRTQAVSKSSLVKGQSSVRCSS